MGVKRITAYIEVLFTVVIWGIASVVIKATLEGIAPISFLAYRFLISSVIALPLIPGVLRLFHKQTNVKILIIVYSIVAGPVALGVLFVGLKDSSVVTFSLLAALSPLLITLLGAKIFHDHLSKKARVGFAIALSGALLTLFEPLWVHFDAGSFYGNILLVLYIASDVVGIIILKKLMKKGVSPFALTNLSFICGLLVFMPLAVAQLSASGLVFQVLHLPFRFHLGVFYMAIFSGTIAFTLRARAQKTLNVTEESIFGYLTPIISTILAILFLNEKITFLYLVGAALIAIGVFIAETKKYKKT